MSRSVPEWIGKSDNTPVPPRVRDRVLDRTRDENGVAHCQLCSRVIVTGALWICDHIRAIINGGENRERNLHAICNWCDKNIKTPADVALKAKIARTRQKHHGIRPRSKFGNSRDGKYKTKIGGLTVLR